VNMVCEWCVYRVYDDVCGMYAVYDVCLMCVVCMIL